MTVVIGTAGHIDHGKTALLRALTGIDADRLPEERRRGMTIDVGYAHMALPGGGEIDFVDVPGHDRLVGNMLVGAGEIDAALLVIAADDGPRAQTLEHLALLDALGICHAVAAVTKADLVPPERAAEVGLEIGGLLGLTSLAGAPVMTVSSVSGEGLDALRDELVALRDRVLAGARALPLAGSRLAVDRAFSIRGRGTVVTGTWRGAPLPRGSALRLVPGERLVRVRGIQVHGRDVATAAPGRAALNLAGVDVADAARGSVLESGSSLVASDRLMVALARPAALRWQGSAAHPPWPPADRASVRLHLGTEQVDAVVGRGGRDGIELADGRLLASLRLGRAIAAAPGDRLVLRRPASGALAAGGVVLDAEPARGVSRRRQTPERVAALAVAIDGADRAPIEDAHLDLHGVGSSGEAGASASTPPRVAADVAVALDATVTDAVRAHHAAAPGEVGPHLAAIRGLLARRVRRLVTADEATASRVADARLEALAENGHLVRDGDWLRMPAHRGAAPDPALLAAMQRLEASLDMPAPPALADAARAAGCPPDGVRALEREGRIVVIAPDLAYAATAYRRLAATALAMAREVPLTPAAYRDATGTSRKYVMAILEDLDRRGILLRTPAGHVPGPRAALG